jgi:hypothetical protein
MTADPSTLWGLIVTAFAVFGWIGIATVAALVVLAFRSYVTGRRRVRVSDATLFAWEDPIRPTADVADPHGAA